MTYQNRSTFNELRQTISGDVHTDFLNTYMLSTDASIYRRLPAGLVYPKNSSDVAAVINFAVSHELPVHCRGAGSGLCGSALGTGIILDFTKYMHRLLHLDLNAGVFECEPGYRFGELEAALEGSGLFFPPDPSSGEYATFGGMYATNASGAHSVKYGNVADYLLDAEVIFYNGGATTLSEILDTPYAGLQDNLKALFDLYTGHARKIETAYPKIKCNSSGYNLRGLVQNGRLELRRLFAGSEGTLGVVTRLKFRLLEKPAHDSLVVAYFDDIVHSAKAVQKIMPLGPSGIEIMDKSLLRIAGESNPDLKNKIPGDIDSMLLIEFDSANPDTCARLAEETQQLLRSEGLTEVARPAVSAAEKAKLWTIRKAAVPILYKLKGPKKIIPLIEDAAVPTEGLVPYFEGLYAIMHRRRVEFVVYGHIAKGLLHTRPLLDMKNPEDVRLLKPLADEVFELVHSLGGAISGEHGDGRIRSAYIKKQYSDIYDLFCEAKQLIDPHNIFNPEIITSDDNHLVEKHLRFGTAYHCRELAQKTLNWKDGFTQEVEKCHGCTQCTTVTTATRMCPVYKFTREEAAAPKAKANILRGLISGAIDDKHLYAETFQNVIEHCINCGSCFAECPSNVNIPKMAIEAKSHYVQRFGPSFENRILVSAELAGRTSRKFSGAIRRFADLPGVKKLGERITGITARREFPYFPAKSLLERIAPREGSGSPKVLYFAGCYASYLQPAIGQSALKVLKQMGMTVLTPPQHCCGLPMLSKGMVPEAKRKVQQNLQKWEDLVKAVDHVVVTCSSCGFSLGHEWNFLVDEAVLETLQNKLVHISRLINQYFDRLTMQNCHLNVAYHNPCHLKIQQDPSCSIDLLSRMEGITIEDLNSHCCGMAGTWGFSAGHYDLSKKIGVDMISKLNASDAPVGVTDCPTCRMQMEHFSTKRIKHPVEVVAECIKLVE